MALEITDMDIEASSGCRFDYLEVRDGHNQDWDKIFITKDMFYIRC